MGKNKPSLRNASFRALRVTAAGPSQSGSRVQRQHLVHALTSRLMPPWGISASSELPSQMESLAPGAFDTLLRHSGCHVLGVVGNTTAAGGGTSHKHRLVTPVLLAYRHGGGTLRAKRAFSASRKAGGTGRWATTGNSAGVSGAFMARASGVGECTIMRHTNALCPAHANAGMGNRLTEIATRTGDDGTTGLGDNQRVSKAACGHAMGDVDEPQRPVGRVAPPFAREVVQTATGSTRAV